MKEFCYTHTHTHSFISDAIFWILMDIAMPPISASDIVGQHNKIGGIRFGVTILDVVIFISFGILVKTCMYCLFTFF